MRALVQHGLAKERLKPILERMQATLIQKSLAPPRASWRDSGRPRVKASPRVPVTRRLGSNRLADPELLRTRIGHIDS